MSSKTKIFVLKSRNLIWTAVIVVIVILLAIFARKRPASG